ncbi:hypothetical protein LPJ72_004839 [Coemansia sp. Benny D160-2]|nr:hypothetical protein LPJ72_004839 [Coemansia sp. Benny D160-2]
MFALRNNSTARLRISSIGAARNQQARRLLASGTPQGDKGNNNGNNNNNGGDAKLSKAAILRQHKDVLRHLRCLTPTLQSFGTRQTTVSQAEAEAETRRLGEAEEEGHLRDESERAAVREGAIEKKREEQELALAESRMRMLDHTAGNVTLETMLAAGMHLGHSAALWNPLNLGYIFGEREGIHIINLERTIAELRRAAHLVGKVAYHGGIILFSGVRKEQRQIAVDAALHADQYYMSRRWVAGTLTNAASVLGNVQKVRYVGDVWDVDEAREFAAHETPAQRVRRMNVSPRHARYLRGIEEEKARLRDEEAAASTYKPDLIVALNPIESATMLAEARRAFVPTVGIVDTNCNPRRVTYAIPCNDDSVRAVSIVAGVLARAARDGLELRRLRLRAAAEQHNAAAVARAAAVSQRPASLRDEASPE